VERAGAVAMLEKPVDDAELMHMLESVFASGG
jgi:FixJ family two-component response regulator